MFRRHYAHTIDYLGTEKVEVLEIRAIAEFYRGVQPIWSLDEGLGIVLLVSWPARLKRNLVVKPLELHQLNVILHIVGLRTLG